MVQLDESAGEEELDSEESPPQSPIELRQPVDTFVAAVDDDDDDDSAVEVAVAAGMLTIPAPTS